MADEKVRRAYDGAPLPPYSEAIVDENIEPYPSITTFATRDGREAVEEEDGRWYEADAGGAPIPGRPVDADQVIL